MTGVPIIDMTPFYEGGEQGRSQVATLIDQACREIGFFAVVNHRVPATTVGDARAAVREFFEQPEEVKMAARSQRRDSGRGYVPIAGENLASTTTFDAAPDMKESWSMGPFEVTADPYYAFEPSGIAFAPNVWPAAPRTFQPTMTAYYEALGALADDLLELTAVAFGLEGDWFAPKSNRPTSALRALHYPPSPTLGDQQYPASPHTDYGTWTILHKRPGPTGLQAQAVDGQWIDVVAPEDGFIVNVGDLLMRWSGGHWLSTLHRVVPIADSDPGGEVSLVYFHQPNWDVVVYPVRTDVVGRREVEGRYQAGSSERHYFGVTVGDFVFGKYQATVSDAALGLDTPE